MNIAALISQDPNVAPAFALQFASPHRTIDLVKRLLAQDRAASEAEDAVVVPARPLPLLTDEQMAATDEMAGLA